MDCSIPTSAASMRRGDELDKGPPTTRTVVVRGEKFELSVERKSKSVWRVSGTYKGRVLRWEGRSVNIAAARWRDHAHISTL
jgi:hypothetical protein